MHECGDDKILSIIRFRSVQASRLESYDLHGPMANALAAAGLSLADTSFGRIDVAHNLLVARDLVRKLLIRRRVLLLPSNRRTFLSTTKNSLLTRVSVKQPPMFLLNYIHMLFMHIHIF